jgi:hypothetical protein
MTTNTAHSSSVEVDWSDCSIAVAPTPGSDPWCAHGGEPGNQKPPLDRSLTPTTGSASYAGSWWTLAESRPNWPGILVVYPLVFPLVKRVDFTGKVARMLEQDYLRALSEGSDAARCYLAAVRRGEERRDLADLAMDLRDRWAAVAMICALGEDAARIRIGDPPWRHRRQACHAAWLDARTWAVRAEDAGARCQMASALLGAHLGEAPEEVRTRPSLRSVDGSAGAANG